MTFWRNIRAALRGDQGNATVEFVMWLPFFFLLFSLVTDVSLLLNMQSRMFDVTRDASRLVSLGRMTDVEAKAWAKTRMDGGASLDVDVSVLNGFVTTTIVAPYSDAIVFGREFVGSNLIRAHMTMVMETAAEAESEEDASAEAEEGA